MTSAELALVQASYDARHERTELWHETRRAVSLRLGALEEALAVSRRREAEARGSADACRARLGALERELDASRAQLHESRTEAHELRERLSETRILVESARREHASELTAREARVDAREHRLAELDASRTRAHELEIERAEAAVAGSASSAHGAMLRQIAASLDDALDALAEARGSLESALHSRQATVSLRAAAFHELLTSAQAAQLSAAASAAAAAAAAGAEQGPQPQPQSQGASGAAESEGLRALAEQLRELERLALAAHAAHAHDHDAASAADGRALGALERAAAAVEAVAADAHSGLADGGRDGDDRDGGDGVGRRGARSGSHLSSPSRVRHATPGLAWPSPMAPVAGAAALSGGGPHRAAAARDAAIAAAAHDAASAAATVATHAAAATHARELASARAEARRRATEATEARAECDELRRQLAVARSEAHAHALEARRARADADELRRRAGMVVGHASVPSVAGGVDAASEDARAQRALQHLLDALRDVASAVGPGAETSSSSPAAGAGAHADGGEDAEADARMRAALILRLLTDGRLPAVRHLGAGEWEVGGARASVQLPGRTAGVASGDGDAGAARAGAGGGGVGAHLDGGGGGGAGCANGGPWRAGGGGGSALGASSSPAAVGSWVAAAGARGGIDGDSRVRGVGALELRLRVGGGYETLDEFVQRLHAAQERAHGGALPTHARLGSEDGAPSEVAHRLRALGPAERAAWKAAPPVVVRGGRRSRLHVRADDVFAASRAASRSRSPSPRHPVRVHSAEPRALRAPPRAVSPGCAERATASVGTTSRRLTEAPPGSDAERRARTQPRIAQRTVVSSAAWARPTAASPPEHDAHGAGVAGAQPPPQDEDERRGMSSAASLLRRHETMSTPR